MVIAEVRIYLANSQVGDWATGGTLAAHEIGCLVKTGYLMESRMIGDDRISILWPKSGPRTLDEGFLGRRTVGVEQGERCWEERVVLISYS